MHFENPTSRIEMISATKKLKYHCWRIEKVQKVGFSDFAKKMHFENPTSRIEMISATKTLKYHCWRIEITQKV